MKSPGGGGKNPGIQKQPMKPQQKPSRPTQEKPAYSPSPKAQYREAQKPERSPEDRKRIAMLDRLKNRQGTAPVSQPGTTGETTAPATSGGRRSCCLGCTVYALALPLAIVAVSLLI